VAENAFLRDQLSALGRPCHRWCSVLVPIQGGRFRHGLPAKTADRALCQGAPLEERGGRQPAAAPSGRPDWRKKRHRNQLWERCRYASVSGAFLSGQEVGTGEGLDTGPSGEVAHQGPEGFRPLAGISCLRLEPDGTTGPRPRGENPVDPAALTRLRFVWTLGRLDTVPPSDFRRFLGHIRDTVNIPHPVPASPAWPGAGGRSPYSTRFRSFTCLTRDSSAMTTRLPPHLLPQNLGEVLNQNRVGTDGLTDSEQDEPLVVRGHVVLGSAVPEQVPCDGEQHLLPAHGGRGSSVHCYRHQFTHAVSIE
jgi:hypothetical protein